MQHLDEGTIHAWLDGVLAPNDASAAEAHVQSCEQCARALAEARGLIAASSRILGALDDVPAVQAPSQIPSLAARRRRSLWRRAGVGYAAAATVLLAAGTTFVLRSVSFDKALESSATAANAPFADTASAVTALSSRGAASERDTDGARRTQPLRTERNVGANVVNEGVAGRVAANRAPSPQTKKEDDLAKDIVVQLPGPIPRPITPAAPPPTVRQEARKVMADAISEKTTVSGVVQGRVLDAATGAPVKGAVVSLDSTRQMTQTDSAGKFELQQVPLGRQTVSVRALGFQAAQHPVAVAPSDSVQLGFALQKAALELRGVVATGTARPQVVEQARRRDAIAPARESVLTDSTSAKRASIAGCYVIRVTARTNAADSVQLDAIPGRVQLGVTQFDTVAGARRALTLDGIGRAESWTLAGDALILTWRHASSRSTARFVATGTRWTGALVGQPLVTLEMERCSG